jgi:hypothetical protein
MHFSLSIATGGLPFSVAAMGRFTVSSSVDDAEGPAHEVAGAPAAPLRAAVRGTSRLGWNSSPAQERPS